MRRKEREEKEKKGTSNSGSSSKMGRVTSASSLCLDCKEKKGGGVSKVSHKKAKKKGILRVTYSSLSSKCRIRSRLSLAASCSTGRGSICR